MSDSLILVTGGAGFIGSHLCDALLAAGHRVRVLDNLSTGKPANLPLQDPRVELIEGDVADAALVRRAVAGCSAVAHLAAVASVQASVDDPVSTHQSNFVGTLNICEAMREAGVRRVLFASSAAVYGNNGEGVAVTEDTPKAGQIEESVHAMIAEVRKYVPGYKLVNGPVIDNDTNRVSIYLEVAGLGDYLPTYAGNLDIMTASAARTAEMFAQEILEGTLVLEPVA